jgi:glutathione S-transferase
LRAGEQNGDDFRRINARGQVPVLDADGTLITESVAVLTYIGRHFPDAGLLPPDAAEQAQCLSLMTWIASQVDSVFRRMSRPERIVTDEAARAAVKQDATEAYWSKCKEIDAVLTDRTWMLGTRYSVCDPYALVYYGWAARFGLPVMSLAGYTALKQRLLERPAVRRVLEREQHPLLKTA